MMKIFIVIQLLFLFSVGLHAENVENEKQLSIIRESIRQIENDLLQTQEIKTGAKSQLGKIQKLIALQKKEIIFSQRRIDDLNRSMQSLSDQKQGLLQKIAEQKISIREKLKELNLVTEDQFMDAEFLEKFDIEHQKERYLEMLSKKELKSIDLLQQSADEALALELRMIEEKGKLDYFIQELKEQNSFLEANEEIQKSILLTNKANRLETLRNLQELRSVEKELNQIMSKLKKETGGVAIRSGLALKKGTLPMPVDGKILNEFGRSYNLKTNLFTFQKGITIKSVKNAEIRAVYDGKIAYAGPLKNYGYIVILEHPGQYYTLYGQLGKTIGVEGDTVKQNEVVGISSDENVYFEIRNKNIAINPIGWFKKVAENK